MKPPRRTLKLLSLALLASIASACRDKPQELRILTWAEFLPEEQIHRFEQEHKTKVTLDFFSSNEELLAKIQANVASHGLGYDLIVPSDYMVTSLARLKLVQAIQKPELAFFADFDPAFMNPIYDPKLEYSIPFVWGATGVAVNTKLAGSKIDLAKGLSWKDLLENPAFKGKTMLLDDMREAFHVALLVKGKTWATATEDDFKAAAAYLKERKTHLRAFAAEARPAIRAEECVLCQEYAGNVFQVAKGKPEVQFLIPREGATLWTDNFAIPVNAPNVTMAHAFINAVLSKAGAAEFTNKTFYPTPNLAAKEGVEASIRSNPAIYLDAATFKRLAYINERPEILPLVDRLWTELKAN